MKFVWGGYKDNIKDGSYKIRLDIYDIRETESEFFDVRHIRIRKSRDWLLMTNSDFEWIKYLSFWRKIKIFKNLLFERKIYTPEAINLDKRFL
jgi:hypothetical protein